LRRLGLGLAAPDQTEQLAMPTEEGVRLNDENGLFPEGRRPCQQDQLEAVPVAPLRVLDLALQYDRLVPQEGVLGAGAVAGGSALLRTVSLAAPASNETVSGLSTDALPHMADGVENARSEAMENVEHARQIAIRQSAAIASRNLAVRSGDYQSQSSESTLQSTQIRTNERSQHGRNQLSKELKSELMTLVASTGPLPRRLVSAPLNTKRCQARNTGFSLLCSQPITHYS